MNASVGKNPHKTPNYSLKRERVANIIKKEKGKISMSQAMLQAGYAKNSIDGKTMRAVRESAQVQNALKENEEKIEKIIQASYKRALETAHKATYRDAINGIDTLTKTKRLIQGKTTENVGVNIASVLNQLENGEI